MSRRPAEPCDCIGLVELGTYILAFWLGVYALATGDLVRCAAFWALAFALFWGHALDEIRNQER